MSCVESKGGAIEAAYGPALDGLDQLEQIRADIDANVAANPNRTIDNNGDFSKQVFDGYTALIAPFFDATTRISLAINDPELRQGTELADAAARQVEVLSQMAQRGHPRRHRRGRQRPRHRGRDHSGGHLRVDLHPAGRGDAQRHRPVRGHRRPRRSRAALTDDVVAAVDTAITEGTVEITALLGALNIPQEESYGAYQQAVADQIGERSD